MLEPLCFLFIRRNRYQKALTSIGLTACKDQVLSATTLELACSR
jgi:hypothetical protein